LKSKLERNLEVSEAAATHMPLLLAGDAAQTEAQDARAAAQQWANAELFEYIEVNTQSAHADAQLTLDGGESCRADTSLQPHSVPQLRHATLSA